MQPDPARTERTLEILRHRLIAIAEPLIPALRLHRLGQLRELGLERVARPGPHVPDLPLRPPAETQVCDMEELFEVHGEGQVRRGGVGKEKAGILRRDARLERLVIELADAVHERQVLIAQAGLLPRFRHDKRKVGFLEGVVALRLLVEGDPVVVAHQLMAGGARKTADREGEIHLGARRGMAALQLVEDERLHLLLSDLARLDVGPDLLWREPRVAGPKRDVHHPDRIGRMGQKLDINRGFHPGPSHFETPTYWCQA